MSNNKQKSKIVNTRVRKKNEKETNEQYDILTLDEKIKNLFKDNAKNIETYKKKLKFVDESLENSEKLSYREILKLTEQKKDLEIKIETVEDVNILSEYLMFSQKIICNYIDHVKNPIKKSFVKKNSCEGDDQIKKKNELILEFLNIAKKYIPIIIPSFEEKINNKCECGSVEFDILSDASVCNQCGKSSTLISSETQFKDADRINMNQKYKYGMKVHFKDTLNQFQGKQNKYIDKKVYTYLEKEFKSHGLVNEEVKLNINDCKNQQDYNNKLRHLKYSKITKDYLKMFLSEIGYNKNYEDINLLHYYYTGIPPHDLSKYENDLLEDFDLVEMAYKKLPAEYCSRLNFLNNQYILFQLLRRRGYKIPISEFSIIKTIDKKIEHDEIYEQICLILEWGFVSLF
jgi:hypothetical protein